VKLLADTSALLALYIRDDRNHRAAAEFVRQNARARFLMTDLVLSETVARLRARASAERAVAVAEDLLHSRRYEVLFVDARIVAGALRRMTRFADRRLSLPDCASFEVMEELGLATAFTFDRDFRDCGYQMVP
jgi:predicted nucleic acid-binding protein